jgi:N-acetylneuraminic acid mutarotase
MIATVVSTGVLPAVAQAGNTATYAEISLSSYSITWGQQVQVYTQIKPLPPTPNDIFHNVTLNIIKPNGTHITFPVTTSPNGSGNITYTPENQSGTYQLQISYPGETFNGTVNITYRPTKSASATLTVRDPNATGDFWITQAPMPTPRYYLKAAAVDNKIYAIGGQTAESNSSILNTNEQYDPTTNTWTTKAPMQTTRTRFASAVFQGRIYCISGQIGTDSLGTTVLTSSNEVYDPKTDTWKNKAPIPKPIMDANANVVDGKIYVLSEDTNGTLIQTYDPQTDIWTTKSAPVKLVRYDISVAIDKKIYFTQNKMEIYDTETNSWSLGSPPPSTVFSGAAAVTSGVFAPVRMYVLGLQGETEQGAMPNRVYEPKTGNWSLGAQVPTNRQRFAVAVLNDTLYAIGGLSLTSPLPGGNNMAGALASGGLSAANEQYLPFGYSTQNITNFAVTPDTWQTKAPMHTARSGLGAAVVNGKIYAIGGSTESGYLVSLNGIVDTNEEYDPATNTWTLKTSMPTPRTGLAVASYQGKIYCIGGVIAHNESGFVMSTVNEVYDPATDTWTTKTPMPTPRSWLSANVVDDKIYLIGGEPNRTLNQAYDPATDSWITKPSKPTGVTDYASAVVGKNIYFTDGYRPKMEVFNTETGNWSVGTSLPSTATGAAAATSGIFAPIRIYFLGLQHWMDQGTMPNRVYDPKNDTWFFGADVPTNRQGFAVAVVNDTLYAIGGFTLTFPSLGDYYVETKSAANEQYIPIGYETPDPTYQTATNTENTWTQKAPIQEARCRLGVAVVNGKIYAIGGNSESWGLVGTNEMYDPLTDTWTTMAPMPTPRARFGIAVYQNKIYVIGGISRAYLIPWTNALAIEELTGINEVYDPATNTWETKAPMPTARDGLQANVVAGKIYLTGGLTLGAQYVNLTEVYDPTTDTWTTAAPIPNYQSIFASAVADNKIYLISDTLQTFNPQNNQWTTSAPPPYSVRQGAAATTTGTKAPKRIYVFAGGPDSNLTQIYNPNTNNWTMGASMPTPKQNSAVAVLDDKIYLIGGTNKTSSKSSP